MEKKRVKSENKVRDYNKNVKNTEIANEITPEEYYPYQALGETTNNIIKGYAEDQEDKKDIPKPNDSSSNR